MTLPKHLADKRDELAEEHGLQVAKHRHDRLPDIKFFGIPKDELNIRSDFKTKHAFEKGFDAAYALTSEREKMLVSAIKGALSYYNPDSFCKDNCERNFHQPECAINRMFEKTLAKLKEEVLDNYMDPTTDIGNVYFAAHEYRQAYKDLEAKCQKLERQMARVKEQRNKILKNNIFYTDGVITDLSCGETTELDKELEEL